MYPAALRQKAAVGGDALRARWSSRARSVGSSCLSHRRRMTSGTGRRDLHGLHNPTRTNEWIANVWGEQIGRKHVHVLCWVLHPGVSAAGRRNNGCLFTTIAAGAARTHSDDIDPPAATPAMSGTLL